MPAQRHVVSNDASFPETDAGPFDPKNPGILQAKKLAVERGGGHVRHATGTRQSCNRNNLN